MVTLALREFGAEGYRSLRKIAYPVSGLDVFVGANGVGKTNLYRGLSLLQSAAANTLGRDIAEEGLAASFWAGERGDRSKPARMRFSVGFSDGERGRTQYRYEVEVGFPPKEAAAAFETEPQVKEESLIHVGGSRSVKLIERRGYSVMARDDNGRPVEIDIDLLASETILGRLEDPSRYPELDRVRRTLLEWRFYHDLRTDPDSPMRRPSPAVASATLASDGSNLAAVFATLAHIREDTVDLDAAISAAFPGAALVTPEPKGRHATFGLRFPDFPQRVFEAPELSDGTLRFLGLAGALMAYRLPPFIALNEPEASLHPDLMEPLADLVARAAQRSQVWLVTHSERLAAAIAARDCGKVRVVTKVAGATQIEGLKPWGAFAEEEDDDED
jgi:predicted ATPase